MLDFLNMVSGYVWGWPLMILLVGTGLWLTFSLRALQFSHLIHAFTLIVRKTPDRKAQGDISNFEALMVALSATVGTGNIAGVATAIYIGGPGALFWMWMTGLVGMATKYAEAVLAVKYRVQNENGTFSGGPMYYISRGLGWKWLATLFASRPSPPSASAAWCSPIPWLTPSTTAFPSLPASPASCSWA